ncbi:MAG: UDP-3-O-(3-hydroxymyristoyl)glucosamine N-acyltransferase [Gammaproteobacteria bacterium]|nr:UDP-3-O-(3-hydroxymyristoyl)glucosamine N-acyltransferase [Gammaproteobacteria bacterium]
MLTLGAIAEHLGAACRGDSGRLIDGVATLSSAGPSQIAFLSNPAYRAQLAATKAGAVILAPTLADECPVDALLMQNPYLGFAQVASLLDRSPPPATGCHGSAIVHPTAVVEPSAHLGPNCVVEAGAYVGANVAVGAGCVVGPGARVGADSRLWANVTLYHGVRIGERCILHSGVVIGSDGFGFAQDRGQWVKIPQTGTVIVEDEVEIGANTVIDRGALDDTRIGRGVKLDNLIQVAHNVQIGENTAIAGCTAIAGSTRVGRNCTIAGGVGIVGHIEIADRVHVAAMTLVTKSITEAGAVASGTGMLPVAEWKKSVARFRQLDDMARRLRRLEALIHK